MTVTEAAKILGVTRVALSSLLNGRTSLSRQMAVRLTAFGADADELLGYQEDALRGRRREEDRKLTRRSYVPPFLQITASQIHGWASKGDEARSRLPVLLRRLIRSTGDELRRVDFPGFGEAQRHGWDGQVEAGRRTLWIPEGKSGWELSTRQDPRAKANDDFRGPRSKLPEEVRAETTFVFVSSRKWPGKTDWEVARKAEGRWKDVRALDASDLEQWLEDSIEGQVWLAEELGLPSLGDCMTLDRAWQEWSRASEPPMADRLFTPAVAEHRAEVISWLDRDRGNRPLLVAADSKDEALAFLSCLFRDGKMFQELADRAVVVNSAQTLKVLAPSTSRFIPIVAGKDAERELASLYRQRACIVVRPRNAVDRVPDIVLGLLRYDAFQEGLLAMGLKREAIPQLARESGRSPTVLRRRLSEIDAIREPPWAGTSTTARKLIPMIFVGAWNGGSAADREVLRAFASRSYDEIEKDVADLLTFDGTPLWAVGEHRGVVSKVDALFAVGRCVTRKDIEDYLDLAEYVLSEADPALAMPRSQRWTAGFYGRVREHSNALRTGVSETLVLLAAHGNDLFQGRLGIDVEARVGALIRRLLRPNGDEAELRVDTLESYDRDLPMLAEAAPDEFLDLLEEDLIRPDPAVRELLRPAEAVFADCPRTGLLWALECLAWEPSVLPRVVSILGQLSETKIDDNHVHKPINSLRAVFQPSGPQTAARPCQRIRVLRKLSVQMPDVGWLVCMNQIADRTGDESYRPRWRSDAAGAVGLATLDEIRESIRAGLDLALEWPGGYDASKLGDLVDHLGVMPEHDRERVLSLVEDWLTARPGDSARVELRERLRRFGHATARRSAKGVPWQRVRTLYNRLAPADPTVRHGWLFARSWVHDWPEDTGEGPSVSGHLERVHKRRRQAMKEIWSRDGLAGVLALLSLSDEPGIVGHYAATGVRDLSERAGVLQACLSDAGHAELDLDESKLLDFVRGFMAAVEEGSSEALVSRVTATLTADSMFRLLLFSPFGRQAWRLVAEQEPEVRRRYWKEVNVPFGGLFSEGECVELLDGLLEAGRPFAAFNLVSMDWDAVETSRLIRLLRAMIAAPRQDAPVDQGMFSFHVSGALESLDGRAGVSRDELADLEFGFSEVLEYEERGVPNLERRVADSPGYFVWLVACAYLRTDGRDDPEGWPAADSERGRRLNRLSHSVLGKIARVPGTEADGTVDVDQLRRWIAEVGRLGIQFGRTERTEICIGELLARRPSDEDRVWPERPICEAIEAVGTERIASGFSTGAINAHRVRVRGSVGGETDRDLALKYRTWAEAHAVEYPFVSRALGSVAGFYEGMVAHRDSDEKLQRRLRS